MGDRLRRWVWLVVGAAVISACEADVPAPVIDAVATEASKSDAAVGGSSDAAVGGSSDADDTFIDVVADVPLPPACTPGDCADDDPCTADGCDPAHGCSHLELVDKIIAGTLKAVLPDGFALLAPAGSDEVVFTRTDLAGHTLWNKSYPTKAGEARAVVGLADGFAIAGRSGADKAEPGLKPTGANGWLLRTDSVGNVLWEKTYIGSAADDEFGAVLALNDGLALGGGKKNGGLVRFWLVRTDAAGKVLWDREYGAFSTNDRLKALAKMPDGFVLAGTATEEGYGIYSSAGLLVRTDLDGDELWSHWYAEMEFSYASGLAVLPDGFALAGWGEPIARDSSALWLVRTDAAGNRLWGKTYGGALFDAIGKALAAVPDGFVLAGEKITYTMTGSDPWLIRTDAVGNTIWDKTYAGPGDEFAAAVAAVPAGLLVQAGARLLRTDAWGHSTCAESGKCIGKSYTLCNDGNFCTADVCDGQAGCGHVKLADGAACGANAACSSVVCVAKPDCKTLICLDGNGCTADVCDPDVGCTHTNLAKGTPCGSSEKCYGGICGKPDCKTLKCDDGNACTSDVCDGDEGCIHADLANGTPCGSSGFCSGGKCK